MERLRNWASPALLQGAALSAPSPAEGYIRRAMLNQTRSKDPVLIEAFGASAVVSTRPAQIVPVLSIGSREREAVGRCPMAADTPRASASPSVPVDSIALARTLVCEGGRESPLAQGVLVL